MPILDGVRSLLGIPQAIDFNLREKRLDLALAEAKALYTTNQAAILGTIKHSLEKSYESTDVPRLIEVFVNVDSREVSWTIRETDDLDTLRDSFFMPSEPIPDMRPTFKAVLDREPKFARPDLVAPKPKQESKQGRVVIPKDRK